MDETQHLLWKNWELETLSKNHMLFPGCKVQKKNKIKFVLSQCSGYPLGVSGDWRGTQRISGMVCHSCFGYWLYKYVQLFCVLVIYAFLYEVSLRKHIKYETHIDWERKQIIS